MENVSVKKIIDCNVATVGLVSDKTNQLNTKLVQTESVQVKGLNKLDIKFTEGAYSGYCEYCYDGVKNYDETGLDCGGPSCPECTSLYQVLNWPKVFSIGSILLVVLLIAGSIFGIYKYKKKIFKFIKY
jgi:hypothetical protein